jgi:hypothetical protein
MAKISIATLDTARRVTAPSGFCGEIETLELFGGARQPIHLHIHRIAGGATLNLGPMAVDCVAFVWRRGLEAGGSELPAGGRAW